MLLALAAISIAASPPEQAGVRAQARVSVRIISGARVEFGRPAELSGQRARPSIIRLEDGTRQLTQLIEFK
jgi:hypothetical protein